MARRLRVAYFVPPSPHFAGVERVVHEIASGLAEAHADRLEISVIYATRYDREDLRAAPYAVRFLGTDRLRTTARALRREVARARVDVLVVAQIDPAVMAWFSTRGLGVRGFITHVHGNPFVELSRGSRRTRIAFWLFRHVVAARTSGVIAVAPSLAGHLARWLGHGVPVRFAKNPLRELPIATSDAVPTRRRFVAVARLDHQKGLDILLEAIAIARRADDSVDLAIVGSGPARDALLDQARALGVEEAVDFVGFVDPGPYLQAAQAFVLSSRWEGFPLVLLEALGAGLPILAADCDYGPADLIVDDRLGELVAPEDPQALAAGLLRFLARTSDDASVHERRAVARSYDRESATESHHRVLRELTAMRTRRRRAPS